MTITLASMNDFDHDQWTWQLQEITKFMDNKFPLDAQSPSQHQQAWLCKIWCNCWPFNKFCHEISLYLSAQLFRGFKNPCVKRYHSPLLTYTALIYFIVKTYVTQNGCIWDFSIFWTCFSIYKEFFFLLSSALYLAYMNIRCSDPGISLTWM